MHSFVLMMLMFFASFAVAGPPQVGDGKVFATVPESPGYPEDVEIDRGRVYVTTQARFDSEGLGKSEILVFNRGNGNLTDRIVVQGEFLPAPHGLSGLKVDGQGRLYALSTQLGVLRFSRNGSHGWTQETYASAFPMVNPFNIPPLPNDNTFLENGDMLVTDSLQGIVWKVSAGGGDPEVWFTDPRIQITGSQQLGPNGIRPSKDGQWVYLAYSGGPAVAEGELAQAGKLYRLPVNNPTSETLEEVFVWDEYSYPDGLAFARKGRLYVTLAGVSEIDVLEEDANGNWSSVGLISNVHGSDLQMIEPANMRFDGTRLVVVNHAVFTAPHIPFNPFALLEVFVGEQGAHLETPNGL